MQRYDLLRVDKIGVSVFYDYKASLCHPTVKKISQRSCRAPKNIAEDLKPTFISRPVHFMIQRISTGSNDEKENQQEQYS